MTGLARWNGQAFTIYDELNTPAFARSHVTALQPAADGSLWIGGYGALVRWQRGRFERFGPEDGRSRRETVPGKPAT